MKQGTIVLVCLVMGLLLLWERNTLLRLGLEIQQLQRAEKAQLQAHRELLIEISSLSSYRRIEEIASTQMGMIRPDPQQVVMVLQNRPSDVPGTPQSPGEVQVVASLQRSGPSYTDRLTLTQVDESPRSPNPNRSIRVAGEKEAFERIGR
jgi:cell division protein FtsL